MNKKNLTEADIRTKFITPALIGSDGNKWDVMTQLLEECYFTKGRVIVRGKTVKRGEAKKADYLLYYKPNRVIKAIKVNYVFPVKPTLTDVVATQTKQKRDRQCACPASF